MHYKRLLWTGVTICQACGATWEVFRIRLDEAICDQCGGPLHLIDDDEPEVQDSERAR